MPASGKLCSPRAEKSWNSRAGSVLPSSMMEPAARKSVVGWRFAPACCAAQSVRQARRRSAVQGSAPARYPGTSGVQNKFFVPWHRAGGAMQFGQRCPLPAQTHPKERQLRSSSLARLMASIFQPFQVEADLNCATVFLWDVFVREADTVGRIAWRLRRDAREHRIYSVHLKSQDTAPALTLARRSCALPGELTARRSTLARSANQHLTSLM